MVVELKMLLNYLESAMTLFGDGGEAYLIDHELYRKYSRSKRGVKIYDKISGKRFERISIIAALLGKKILAPMVFNGYTDANVFNQWLEQCLLP